MSTLALAAWVVPKSIADALRSLLYHTVGDGRKSALFSLGLCTPSHGIQLVAIDEALRGLQGLSGQRDFIAAYVEV